MQTLRINSSQKLNLGIATAVILIVSVIFLKNYLMLIAISAIVAYLFNPIYKWLLKKKFKKGSAATLTFLISLLAVIIPVIIVSLLIIAQVNQLIDSISTSGFSVNVNDFISIVVNRFNETMQNFGINTRTNVDQVNATISSGIKQFEHTLVSGIVNSISGAFSFITTAIIYIYVFMSMLTNGDKIVDSLSKINPLGEKIGDLYLDRMGQMTKATVRGQFIIALCQGLESSIVLYMAGLDNLFFFFLVLLTTLSIVPLGAGIVTIPLGLIMALTGNLVPGIIIIANHLLIVTNIDNILRPKLVPKNSRLDPALMMLAVFAGIGYFGFAGIVIGPVLMIIIVTTIQLFLIIYKNTGSLTPGEQTKIKKKSLINKINQVFNR